MNNQELYLKTVFACMACDGSIADEEIQLVRDLVATSDIFKHFDVEVALNQYIKSINENGVLFLNQYLNNIDRNKLTKDEQMCIIDLAFRTIEADKHIEYSEVKFFKKIRSRLSLTDDEIIAKYSEKEDFLLPDINISDDLKWNNKTFAEITLNIDDTKK